MTAQEWRQRFDAAFSKALPIPRGLQAELRDYQIEGYRWLARLAELELGAYLADDMGLGKTVEIIALLLRRCADGAVLVVAPTSVCTNWRREIERFAPSLRVRDYAGQNRAELLVGLGKRDVVITSYTLLQQDGEALAAIEWSTAVLDEGQFIKNAETRRAKAAFALCARVRIVATGTPIENHPNDLWSLFHFLNPHLLGSAQRFQRSFGRAAEGRTTPRQDNDGSYAGSSSPSFCAGQRLKCSRICRRSRKSVTRSISAPPKRNSTKCCESVHWRNSKTPSKIPSCACKCSPSSCACGALLPPGTGRAGS